MNTETKERNAQKIAKRIGGIFYKPRQTWLTHEIAQDYLNRAKKLPDSGGQDIDEWRRLRIELQEYCGISELEAFDVLRGFHIGDYVKKYQYISEMKPSPSELDTVEGDLALVRKYIYDYGSITKTDDEKKRQGRRDE